MYINVFSNSTDVVEVLRIFKVWKNANKIIVIQDK